MDDLGVFRITATVTKGEESLKIFGFLGGWFDDRHDPATQLDKYLNDFLANGMFRASLASSAGLSNMQKIKPRK
jgi:hypothetical protein